MKETVVYTCLDYAMLPGDGEILVVARGEEEEEESEGNNGREAGRGEAGRFLQLL